MNLLFNSILWKLHVFCLTNHYPNLNPMTVTSYQAENAALFGVATTHCNGYCEVGRGRTSSVGSVTFLDASESTGVCPRIGKVW
jgi:hypothetical protein